MSKAKILIVDDEEEIVRALTMRLQAAGYETISANNGLQAIQMATNQSPDLVILDIGMAPGDGHAVARRLMHQPATAFMPIVFLTASDSAEDRKKACAVEPAAYLNKPYDANDLLSIINRALTVSQQVQSNSMYDWRIA